MGELSVQQRRDRVVTFTVERREYEDQHTQHDPPDDEFLPVIIQAPVHSLDPVHDFGELERHQAAEDTKQ